VLSSNEVDTKIYFVSTSLLDNTGYSIYNNLDKKLSYRRESAHLTSLYRMVQKALYRPMLSRLGVWITSSTDRQTDGRADIQTIAIAYSAEKPISIKSRAYVYFQTC